MTPPRRIVVFCGANPGRGGRYRDAARQVGTFIARAGIGVVYGGASIGMMAEVADAALAAGGEVIGVIPRHLAEAEVAHAGLSELHIVETMHERKTLMLELSEAALALPGGSGTLDELFEALTWAQLGLHTKPIGLLDVAGYWRGLLRFLDHAVTEGFLQERDRARLIVGSDPTVLLERLADAL